MAAIGKGQAPYGFRWKGGTLQIDPDEAATRRRAFELFRELKSKGAVARSLNESGAVTRRGGTWSDMQIGRILTCQSAIGRYVFNKTTSSESEARVATPEADQVPVTCDPIVSQSLWDDVAALLRSQVDSPPAPDTVVHALVGLAYCRCGQKMRVLSGTPKYTCPACHNKIPVAALEGIVLEELVDFVGQRREFAEAIADTPERAEVRGALREIEGTLKTERSERSKVEKLYLEGMVTERRFGELHRPLDLRIEENETKRADLEKQLSRLAEVPPQEAVHLSKTELTRRWPKYPPATRRRIARIFIEKIVVGDGDIEICYWFGDSSPKDTASAQQTNRPTNQPSRRAGNDGPVYIRLPKPGERCPHTGMSRTTLNELILPIKRNNFCPPVASKSVRERGSTRGVRLILLESLLDHLASKS